MNALTAVFGIALLAALLYTAPKRLFKKYCQLSIYFVHKNPS